jgi:hypothetical protein
MKDYMIKILKNFKRLLLSCFYLLLNCGLTFLLAILAK